MIIFEFIFSCWHHLHFNNWKHLLNDFITKFCALKYQFGQWKFNATTQMNLNLKFNFVTTRIISNVTIFGEINSCKKQRENISWYVEDWWVCSKKTWHKLYHTRAFYYIFFCALRGAEEINMKPMKIVIVLQIVWTSPIPSFTPSFCIHKKVHTALLKYYIVCLAVCFFILLQNGIYSSSSQFNFPFFLSLSLTYCVVYKIQ